MSKIKLNFSSLIIVGLLASTIPAHAEASFLDSINKKLTDLSKEISDQIKTYYGDNKDSNPIPQTPSPTTVVLTPVKSDADLMREKLSECRKFVDFTYDTTYTTDAKKIATIYLNAVLDTYRSSYDKEISATEIEARNKCAELALELGADPNSNGRERREGSISSFDSPAPIVTAVRNNNGVAVKLLLEYKADPNAKDTTMGTALPLLNAAITGTNQDIAVDLINAGSDLTTEHLLWIAASNAADKVVDLLIQSKQIPVNQLNKFSDYTEDSEAQTALDASESQLHALKRYQKNFYMNSQVSLEEKVSEANSILYYNYPLKPQIKMKKDGKLTIDPDTHMNDLLIHQQNISDSLKAAGWSCNLENCGVLEFEIDNEI